MARIPEHEIERLKNDVSVATLAEQRGIVLKRQGDNLIGCCPFHDDKTPSLVISVDKNLWNCLGACQMGGSVIDWVMKANGISFRHAVELLRADSPLAAGVEGVRVKISRSVKLPSPVLPTDDDQELLNQVIEFYHQTLLESPEALAYLAKRGITDHDLIHRFKLGFVNRTLGYRLPAKNLKAGAEIKSRLQGLGILRESGHEHFNGSIVVPIMDTSGNITEVYGRKIRDDLRTGTPMHLYLPNAHRGIWNEAGVAEACSNGNGEVILCEALIDAVTFWQAGYHNVTSSYGVSGFTPDHIAAFQRYSIKRVLIAYDRDEAGDKAAASLTEQLIALGIECYRIQFPKDMDANEYALKATPADKSLGILIRKAVWCGIGTPPQVQPEQVFESKIIPSPLVVPVAASPTVTPISSAEIDCVIGDDEIIFTFSNRRYRVRGLPKNLSPETLKINLLVSCGEAFYVDSLDLYSARSRQHYLTDAAKELAVSDELIKHDLGRILLKLETLQSERMSAATETKKPVPTMTDVERDAALELLCAPDLLDRIVTDFNACGLVGERTNKLVGYLAAVSRKLDRPLAIVVQSSSAAGKSSLMDAVLAMIPEEERIKYSAMTGQSLFYMGETNLQHKILAIVEEEGASRASYALKLLQSEGELMIATTGKDAVTGNMITQEYKVTGPVMIFLTTTAIEVDEELMNRCIVLSVDEGRKQTEAIHQLQRQRRTLSGLMAKQGKDAILNLHRNAQRLLRPLAIVNPYAYQLTFISDKTRTRRDHEKYLTLIDTIALLHQHQRPIKTIAGSGLDYIEVSISDIEQANRLSHEVLGRSLDELPPQTRRLLGLVNRMVERVTEEYEIRKNDYRFSRKDVRTATGWGDTQLKIHLARLVELEYLLFHPIKRGQGYQYELLYDGSGAQAPHLSGLLDTALLAQGATLTHLAQLKTPPIAQNHDYDNQRSGLNPPQSDAGRGLVGGMSGTGRTVKTALNALQGNALSEHEVKTAQNALISATAQIQGHNHNVVTTTSVATLA